MRRVYVYILLVFAMLFLSGCKNPDIEPVPENAEISDELLDKLQLPSMPEDSSSIVADVKYHIIMDSRIASSSNRSGYLNRNCATLQQILFCLKTSVSGKEYQGYFTNQTNVYKVDQDTQDSIIVGVSNFAETDDVFAMAASEGFPNTDILPSETIAQMAREVTDDSVYVFITDLAMPETSESYRIINALSDGVIANNNLTLGLIGIQADYSGTVCDIPISKLGVELPSGDIYKKPVYLIYIGQKEAVFELMNDFLQTSQSNDKLNEPGQIKTLYYYKYDLIKNAVTDANGLQQPLSITYSGRLNNYMKQQYNPNFIFTGIPDDMKTKVLFQGMSLSKVYSGILSDDRISNEKNNLQFSFMIPFEVAFNSGAVKSDLLRTGEVLRLSDLSLSLTADISRIVLSKDDSMLHIGSTESVDSKELNISTDNAEFDLESGTVNVSGDYDISCLRLDEPTIYLVRMAIKCAVPTEALVKSYDVSWLNDWQMDLVEVQKGWGRKEAIELVLKTPYLADIFGNALYGANIAAVQQYISDRSVRYVRGIDFGFVLREQALFYDKTGDWEDTEDFGWAFSKVDIDRMIKN